MAFERIFLILNLGICMIYCTTTNETSTFLNETSTIISTGESSTIAFNETLTIGQEKCDKSSVSWKCCITPAPLSFIEACVQIIPLGKDDEAHLLLIVNKDPMHEEKISLKDPQPVCTTNPALKFLVSVCLKFYDMNIEDAELFHSGCMRLEVHQRLNQKIGCFQLVKNLSEHTTQRKAELSLSSYIRPKFYLLFIPIIFCFCL